jgi:hypothetical protein
MIVIIHIKILEAKLIGKPIWMNIFGKNEKVPKFTFT